MTIQTACGVLAIVAGLSLAGTAWAEDYRLGAANEKALMLLDMDSFRRSGDIVRFDSLMFSRKSEDIGGRFSWAVRFDNELDCRTDQRRERAISFLAEGGGLIDMDSTVAPWKPAAATTHAKGLRDLICDGATTADNVSFGRSFLAAEQMARPLLGH